MDAPAYYVDRADLNRAQRLAKKGRHEEAWRVLRAVLLRHPWRPKRIRSRLPEPTSERTARQRRTQKKRTKPRRGRLKAVRGRDAT